LKTFPLKHSVERAYNRTFSLNERYVPEVLLVAAIDAKPYRSRSSSIFMNSNDSVALFTFEADWKNPSQASNLIKTRTNDYWFRVSAAFHNATKLISIYFTTRNEQLRQGRLCMPERHRMIINKIVFKLFAVFWRYISSKEDTIRNGKRKKCEVFRKAVSK